MLRYKLNSQVFDNDVATVKYSGVELARYQDDPDNFMWVTLLNSDANEVVPGDILTITSTFNYYNNLTHENSYFGDSVNVPVSSVDVNSGTISFINNRYKMLNIEGIRAEIEYTYIPYRENRTIQRGSEYYYYNELNYTYTKTIASSDITVPEDNTLYYYIDNSIRPKIMWVFEFGDTHYFAEDEDITLIIQFDNISIEITDVFYIDFQTLGWVYYDETVSPVVDNTEYAGDVSEILFGSASIIDNVNGNINGIRVKREQVMWNNAYNQDTPSITHKLYKVRLNVPISMKDGSDLYKEGNLAEYFVQREVEKVINSPIEMEKYAYTPVVVSGIVNGKPTFEDCTKINFNLHFRVHDGDDWTVSDTNTWNFDKYGSHNTPSANKYYSYAQNINPMDVESQWKRSCQSDLLTYAGFITNDVRYQKNKLKKSFIRLSFYDSDNPGSQNLLAYSTIFVDCNKLYSKFISKMNFNCYFNSDGDIVKGIKVDREVNTAIHPDSLVEIIGKKKLGIEDIEEYRLSSQISVKNRFTSDNSSEGFYLYTWELDDNPTEPVDVYMKVEFNHAGYGRNIPMMAPYEDNPINKGFKTNEDIVRDWTAPNNGYGIKKYTRYSYIHLKAKYDTNTKRHIYYIDPDTYGTNYNRDKNILNINLYEARISFDQ